MSLLGALTQEEFCIQCLGINFSHQVCPSPLGWQMSSQAATTGRTFLQVMSKQFLGEDLKELLLGTGAMGLHWAINSPQLLCSPGQAQCRHQGCPGAVHPLMALLELSLHLCGLWAFPDFSQVPQPVCLWDIVMWVRPEVLWGTVLATKQTRARASGSDFWREKPNQTIFRPMWKQALCM